MPQYYCGLQYSEFCRHVMTAYKFRHYLAAVGLHSMKALQSAAILLRPTKSDAAYRGVLHYRKVVSLFAINSKVNIQAIILITGNLTRMLSMASKNGSNFGKYAPA